MKGWKTNTQLSSFHRPSTSSDAQSSPRPSSLGSSSAQAVQRQYDLLVKGARPVRLAHVEFVSESRSGVLAVTSRVRLHAGEPTIGSFGERFAVRAEFTARDGKVVMTSLSGVND